MRLLLIDVCGATGSVALAEDGAVAAAESMPGRSASERLVPVVRELLAAHGWRLSELAGIGVVHGPGSFTGVRIGLSAAKGLSEASGVGLVAVSRLALLAAASGVPPFAEGAKDGAPGGSGESCVALDAGRGEFYLAVEGVESLVNAGELAEAVGQRTLVVCEQRLAEALANVIAVRLVREPVAADALGLVRERVLAERFDDAATVDANYLRRTDGLFGRPAR